MSERIKIFTRSFDLKLYRNSRGLYEMLGFPVVRLTDQTADGYFYTMLADTDCDIAINIDEDAFLVDPDAMMAVVRAVIDGGYANAGCPDGGGWCPRGGNPIVTNPFFNVFNLKLIRTKFNKSAIKSFDYQAHKKKLIAAFPKERLERSYDFDRTNYEPYYQFFFWLAYNFKTLYLPSSGHNDGFTTIVLTPDGKPICKHSWLARFYSTPTWIVHYFQPSMGKQKLRIDALIEECYAARDMHRPVFGFNDHIAFIANKIIRWIIKVPQRISRWPHKLHLKLSKQK